MAAAALTPRVRIMAVCDGVQESKTESGVFHLRGVRQKLMTKSLFPKGAGRVPPRLRQPWHTGTTCVCHGCLSRGPLCGTDSETVAGGGEEKAGGVIAQALDDSSAGPRRSSG